jgi:hypothetical protein
LGLLRAGEDHYIVSLGVRACDRVDVRLGTAVRIGRNESRNEREPHLDDTIDVESIPLNP